MAKPRLAIVGASGAMGCRLVSQSAETFELSVVVGRSIESLQCAVGAGVTVAGDVEFEAGQVDVVIDFSTADVTMGTINHCRTTRTPLVIGTTGFSDEQLATIEAAAQEIPLLRADNFSLGVNVLFSVVKRLSAALPRDYDIEIVETHHRRKVDAPSGTAKSLLAACQRGRNSLEPIYGREGMVGPRLSEEIGMHAVRMGDIVGEHEVRFGGPGECITISHSALNRDLFANGAIRAALWLSGVHIAGLYSMSDVLGLEDFNSVS